MIITKKQLRGEAIDAIIRNPMQTFDNEVQAVWAEKDLVAKKKLAIDTVISKLVYNKQIPSLIQAVEESKNGTAVDTLVTNIMFRSYGERVIK